MNIFKAMESLGNKRKIFYSEADFQFTLAWEIKSLYPDYEMRLEVPYNINNKKVYIDIVVMTNEKIYPVELKYLKKNLHYSVNNEQFDLAEGVHDMDMYKCIADISRLEDLRNQSGRYDTGYAIWLSNDSSYWDSNYDASYYKEFHAPNDSIKSGKMYYKMINPRTGKPPQIIKERKYQNLIILNDRYHIKWNDYSDLGIAKGQFKYAVIFV